MTNIEHKTVTTSVYFSIMFLSINHVNEMFIAGLIITVFASTFPDFDLRIFGSGSSPDGFLGVWGHRGIMHYYKVYIILYFLILAGLFALNFREEIKAPFFFLPTCFIAACLAHIAEDSVTTAGVPIYRADKKLYKSFSFHVGNFDSNNVSYLAWGIVIVNMALSAYLIHVKNISFSLWGWRHA